MIKLLSENISVPKLSFKKVKSLDNRLYNRLRGTVKAANADEIYLAEVTVKNWALTFLSYTINGDSYLDIYGAEKGRDQFPVLQLKLQSANQFGKIATDILKEIASLDQSYYKGDQVGAAMVQATGWDYGKGVRTGSALQRFRDSFPCGYHKLEESLPCPSLRWSRTIDSYTDGDVMYNPSLMDIYSDAFEANSHIGKFLVEFIYGMNEPRENIHPNELMVRVNVGGRYFTLLLEVNRDSYRSLANSILAVICDNQLEDLYELEAILREEYPTAKDVVFN